MQYFSSNGMITSILSLSASSTFLFNVFYRDLVELTSGHDGDVAIQREKFNIFCYADDNLIVSTTLSGLEGSIHSAVEHMSRQGLRFNPEKIICWTVKGNNSFFVSPQLSKVDNINHLVAYVGNNCNDTHIDRRIGTCRSFYSFQAAEN